MKFSIFFNNEKNSMFMFNVAPTWQGTNRDNCTLVIIPTENKQAINREQKDYPTVVLN